MLAAVLQLGVAVVLLLVGCAAAPAPKPAAAPATEPAPAPTPAPEPTPVAATRTVKVKGLTGTLNTDDVNQTMEARQDALTDCIMHSRRRLRWIHGNIHFAFRVDAEGAVTDVHPTTSDIGHHVLESCILQVLAQTKFPKPAGDASAEFEWSLSVDPATPRVPDPAEPDFLEPVLKKHAQKILDECEVKRRDRFQVTAYINRRGKVISCGAVSRPTTAAEKAPCVLEALAKLKMPKRKQDAKVSFELK
jgi:hypothetical protein